MTEHSSVDSTVNDSSFSSDDSEMDFNNSNGKQFSSLPRGIIHSFQNSEETEYESDKYWPISNFLTPEFLEKLEQIPMNNRMKTITHRQ